MQTSGANTTKRRVRRYWVAAVPIIAMFVPLGGSSAAADPVTDTLCTVRGLLNVLVEPCTQASPQPSAAPTAAPTARPSTRASASPDAPPKARTLLTTTGTSPGAVAPVQDGTFPPSQSEPPAPSSPGDDGAVTAPGASPFGIAELIFVGLMSAGLGWMFAARRRRRLDAEADAALSRIEGLKTEILSVFSHEMITPLTGLLGYASMLRSGKVSKSQVNTIADHLIDASKKLERTIDLLVTFAAIRGGTRTPRPRPVDAASLAERVAGDARSRYPKRSIDVAVARSLPELTADAGLIRDAVDQLVDNAVKFSPKGTPVTIGVHAGPPESGTIEFVVTDQGIGIEPADQTAVFDAFHQVDGSSTREFGGIGLGLAFAASVAEMHGGTIEVDSEPGAGSTFTFRIRTAAAAQPVPVRAAEPVAAIRRTAA